MGRWRDPTTEHRALGRKLAKLDRPELEQMIHDLTLQVHELGVANAQLVEDMGLVERMDQEAQRAT